MGLGPPNHLKDPISKHGHTVRSWGQNYSVGMQEDTTVPVTETKALSRKQAWFGGGGRKR